MDGDDGGYGIMYALAVSTASFSIPAKTVTNLLGFLAPSIAMRTPGRAFAAAHPHTELTITKTVPSDFTAESTSVAVNNCSKPTFVNSSRIGATIYSGYIIFYFKYKFIKKKCFKIAFLIIVLQIQYFFCFWQTLKVFLRLI